MLDKQSATDIATTRILNDPSFQALVQERTSFGWVMSGLMLIAYLGFVFLAALDNGFMSATIGDSSVSWGILLGLFIIVFAFALTGLYVARANTRYDDLTAQLDRDVR